VLQLAQLSASGDEQLDVEAPFVHLHAFFSHALFDKWKPSLQPVHASL
jgi:hypothetical protein